MRPAVERVGRLHRLAVFEAAARLGSFTRAAGELGMTQPAVTRQIRALERSLGCELFVRSANRSELTEAGRRLREHVAAGFDAIEAGLRELDDHAGTFVLAAHPGVVQMWLMQRLDQLQQALGDVDLRLWLFERDAELVDGSFDAAPPTRTRRDAERVLARRSSDARRSLRRHDRHDHGSNPVRTGERSRRALADRDRRSARPRRRSM